MNTTEPYNELDAISQPPSQSPETTPAGLKRTRPWGTIVLLLGVAAVIVVFGIQLARQNRGPLQPGDTMPDFTLQTFDGSTVATEQLRGRILVVNFWGSWCPPCRDEAPDLQLINEQYAGQGVVMIGVNRLDTDADAMEFIDQYGFSFANGADTGDLISRSFRLSGTPETYIIDRDGVVQSATYGTITYDRLVAALDAIIDAQAGTDGGAS